MTETIPADFIDKPDTGYLYVALLSEDSQAQIIDLLTHLSRELPEIIWTMPAQSLHITLLEIIQARKSYNQDKVSLYESHQDIYERATRPIFSTVKAFSVTFDTIEASEQAIIVRATDDGQFAALRSSLAQDLPLPSDTKAPPNIIHSSIARYTKAVDLAKVQAIVAAHEISFDEPITEFKLLKTLVPPLLDYQEIASYPLSN